MNPEARWAGTPPTTVPRMDPMVISPAIPTPEQRRNVVCAPTSDLLADPVKAAACRRFFQRFGRQVHSLGHQNLNPRYPFIKYAQIKCMEA